MALVDRCVFTPASGGTGDFVVSAAFAGYQTPAQANAVNGSTYSYFAEIRNSSGVVTDWEVGQGAYTSGTTTLARTTVLFSSNSNAKVNFGSAPTVGITALAEDFDTQAGLSGLIDLAFGSTRGEILFRGVGTWGVLGTGTSGQYLKTQGVGNDVAWDGGTANPTATASDTAVNGVATTFMRSDAAPAVQKTSSSQFGLCKVDNVTITASSGVITSVGGAATLAVGSSSITGSTGVGAILWDSGPGTLEESANFEWNNSTSTLKVGANSKCIIQDAAGNNALYVDNNAVDIFMGSGAGNIGSFTGNTNIAIGELAMQNAGSASSNIAIGFAALLQNTTGGNNIAIGASALQGAGGAAISRNVAIGNSAGAVVTTANDNVLVGASAGGALTSGHDNFALGSNALKTATTDPANVAIGSNALKFLVGSSGNNVAIGSQAAINLVSGSSNTAIGSGAGGSWTGTESDNTIIGGYTGVAGTNFQTILSDGAGQLVYVCDGTNAKVYVYDGNGHVLLDYANTNAGKWTFAKAPVLPSFTVSTLPAGVTGAHVYITDGDAGLAWGATAVNSGSGATKYLVWYNGTNWTIVGK